MISGLSPIFCRLSVLKMETLGKHSKTANPMKFKPLRTIEACIWVLSVELEPQKEGSGPLHARNIPTLLIKDSMTLILKESPKTQE